MRLMYNEACPRGTRSGDSAAEDEELTTGSCSGNNVQGEKRNEGWRVNEEAGTRFSFKKEGSLRNWWIVLYELRAEVYHPLTKTL